MAIRKTGAVTGEVTGTEPTDEIRVTAGQGSPWTAQDEEALQAESGDVAAGGGEPGR